MVGRDNREGGHSLKLGRRYSGRDGGKKWGIECAPELGSQGVASITQPLQQQMNDSNIGTLVDD